RGARRADVTITVPDEEPPTDAAAVAGQGADYWPLRVTRELDDLILHLRTNEQEVGTWVLRVRGEHRRALAFDAQLRELADDWFVREVNLYLKRTFKRLDVTSRSLFA